MDKIKEKFTLPVQIIEQLYELSGSGATHKGFFLAIVDEDGDPSIYFKHDSKIVELGLRAAIDKYLKLADEQDSGIMGTFDEEYTEE